MLTLRSIMKATVLDCIVRLGLVTILFSSVSNCQTDVVLPSKFCEAGVTSDVDTQLTWPQTAIGEVAVSSEKCSSATAGGVVGVLPFAVRICNVSEETGQPAWSSVQRLKCADEDDSKVLPDSGVCPTGWELFMSNCYYVNTENHVHFHEAVEACKKLNSNLTSIHSLEEQLYHLSMYHKNDEQDLWIGLQDTNKSSRNFEWVDGSPVDYENWAEGQPDNRKQREDCAHLWRRRGGMWNDRGCDGKTDLLGYICKQPAVASEVCASVMSVREDGGRITWPETTIGNIAHSEETCEPNTDSGVTMPIGLRYCSPNFEDCESDEKEEPKDILPIRERCPENWHGHSGYCYFINKTLLDFEGARSACNQYDGSSLASIHTISEQLFLEGITKDVQTSLYIGLNDVSMEEKFQWTDGTPYNYSNWEYNDDPDNSENEDCVLLNGKEVRDLEGLWSVAPCSSMKWSICKTREICNDRLGMETGKIADAQISASSEWDSNHGPTRARLNQPREGVLRGAWTAGRSSQNRDQWIQVSFSRETVITGVITQGQDGEDQWVTRYVVEFTQDGSTWRYVKARGGNTVMEFAGNTDQQLPVEQALDKPITVTAIRIRPKDWNRFISMRFELVGCIEKDDSCTADYKIGWPLDMVDDRAEGDMYYRTYAIPGKEFPCDGFITHWKFTPVSEAPFRVIVWRHVRENQYKIVGIHDIPASDCSALRGAVTFEVPIPKRFYVKKGDVLGLAHGRSSLLAMHYHGEASRVVFFRNRDPNTLQSGEVHTFERSFRKTAYSLHAIVSPIANGSKCAPRAKWGPVNMVPCNKTTESTNQEALTPSTPPANVNQSCPANVTREMDDAELTWPETEIGKLAYSNERCPLDTVRGGWPLALRFCNVSGETGQPAWSSVQRLRCSDEDTEEVLPISSNGLL